MCRDAYGYLLILPFFHISSQINRYTRVCIICPRLISTAILDSIWKKCSRCSIAHSDEVLRGKCVGEDTSFIPRDENSASRKKRVSRHGESSLVERSDKKKKPHLVATATMSRRNKRRDVYYCLSIKSRNEEKEEEEGGFHGTWREKFFNFLSGSSGLAGNKERPSDSSGNGRLSLLFNTHYHHSPLFLLPLPSHLESSLPEESSKNRERAVVPKGEGGGRWKEPNENNKDRFFPGRRIDPSLLHRVVPLRLPLLLPRLSNFRRFSFLPPSKILYSVSG